MVTENNVGGGEFGADAEEVDASEAGIADGEGSEREVGSVVDVDDGGRSSVGGEDGSVGGELCTEGNTDGGGVVDGGEGIRGEGAVGTGNDEAEGKIWGGGSDGNEKGIGGDGTAVDGEGGGLAALPRMMDVSLFHVALELTKTSAREPG